jgi:hypothetical protein
MNADLTPLLDGWPYEPGRINVRLIELPDGGQRVQVRLDLGLLQMHLDGRPDGKTPEGYESLLDLVEDRLEVGQGEHDQEHGEQDEEDPSIHDTHDAERESPGPMPPPPNGSPGEHEPKLNRQQVAMLRDEAIQYYHRYLALLHLEDFERVVRDTSRNLRMLDLIERHAEAEEDRESVAPTRAHVTMMRARALASLSLRDNETKAALAAIDEGIDALRRHFAAQGRGELFERSTEVQVLQSMKQALMPRLPVSQKAELRQRLEEAVAQENYRLAAILRDELNAMPD